MNKSIAQNVAEFAHACATSPAGYSRIDTLEMAQRNARANGGKARTYRGVLLGYRFADGSAVTADCIEYMGTFSSELRIAAKLEHRA